MKLPFDSDMTHCRGCGKIIHAAPGRRLCRACSGDYAATDSAERPEEDAARRHEEQEALLRAVYKSQPHTPEQAEAHGDRLCIRCGKHGRLEHSEFCLTCQVDLYHEISRASEDAEEAVNQAKRHQIRSHRIDRALDEKRSRTTSERVQFNPPNWRY